MKKVFIIHGHKGIPNGAWRPWLMTELEKNGIYACALPMQGFESPNCKEWVSEIKRQVDLNSKDEIYLVGHSLGGTAILSYLEENSSQRIGGVVLVSTPIEKTRILEINNFFEKSFNYENIKSKSQKFIVIHGENDTYVPSILADKLSKSLDCELILIPNGGHLSGSEGFHSLPEVLKSLLEIMGEDI